MNRCTICNKPAEDRACQQCTPLLLERERATRAAYMRAYRARTPRTDKIRQQDRDRQRRRRERLAVAAAEEG